MVLQQRQACGSAEGLALPCGQCCPRFLSRICPLIRPVPPCPGRSTSGTSIKHHLLASYRESFGAVLEAQLGSKPMPGGREAVEALWQDHGMAAALEQFFGLVEASGDVELGGSGIVEPGGSSAGGGDMTLQRSGGQNYERTPVASPGASPAKAL